MVVVKPVSVKIVLLIDRAGPLLVTIVIVSVSVPPISSVWLALGASVAFPLPPLVPRVDDSRTGEERVALPVTASGVVLPAGTTSSPAAGNSLVIHSLAKLQPSLVLRCFQILVAIIRLSALVIHHPEAPTAPPPTRAQMARPLCSSGLEAGGWRSGGQRPLYARLQRLMIGRKRYSLGGSASTGYCK